VRLHITQCQKPEGETFTGQSGLSVQSLGQASFLPLKSLDIWSAYVSALAPSPKGLLAGGEEMRWPRSWLASLLLSAATASLEHTLLLCAEKAKSQHGSLAQSIEDSKSP